MFQKHLIDEAGLHFGEFMNDLSKILVILYFVMFMYLSVEIVDIFRTDLFTFQIQDFEEKLNFYVMGCLNFFKSPWPELRGSAALCVGE